MKNFARLARFAWPYRLRFAVSLGCAVMVAALWFTNIGAVYPLLKILFYSQNPQVWVDEQIDSTETGLAARAARLSAMDDVERWHAEGEAGYAKIDAARVKASREANQTAKTLADEKSKLGDINARPLNKAKGADALALSTVRRDNAVAEARLEELGRATVRLVKSDDPAGFSQRRATLTRDQARDMTWLGRYQSLKPFIDRYLPSDAFRTLLLLIGLVMAGVAIKGLFQFCQEVLVADITQLSLFDIRNLFYRRTMALDLAAFSSQGSAELMSRFTSDMDSVAQGFNTVLSKVIREPLRILTCLAGAMWLNWRLTCLALVLVPVSAYCTMRAGQDHEARRATLFGEHVEHLQDPPGDVPGDQGREGVHDGAARAPQVLPRNQEPVPEEREGREDRRPLGPGAGSARADDRDHRALGGVVPRASGDDLPEPRPVQAPARRRADADRGLADAVRDAGRDLGPDPQAGERAFEGPARRGGLGPDLPVDGPHPRGRRDKPAAARLGRHKMRIDFEGVGFGYTEREPVIRGLDLTVRHGETIALVGPNGCGKSTLMNLLPRFWDVSAGSIRIDGHDLRDIQIRSLRSQIGYVTQETVLFQGTVADNIAYGTRHATRERIVEAAKRSYAHAFIESMPGGYDGLVGERGLSLSGGQRQRIALARAMLRDPAILILDEATSAVDIQDEALIRKAIEEFSRERTTFLITHSLGSLQFADRIVLMNAGRVEAVGTDAELRKTSPLYRRLNEIHFQRESA